MKNDTKVSFEIYGFNFSPQEISNKIGIEPTETWIKGDLKRSGPKGKTQAEIKIKENVWILSSELDANEPIENHLEHLLIKLLSHKNSLQELTQKYNTQFRSTLLYTDFDPYINLDKKILKDITSLNASLKLDFYFLSE